MLNLAGVPSIVFGLFGLGLFVILAPLCDVHTKNIQCHDGSHSSKLGTKPGSTRIIEQQQIYICRNIQSRAAKN